MFTVSIKITNLDKALQSLANIKGAVNNLGPETQMLGDFLMDYFTNKVFDSSGGILGEPWVALSTKYAIWKAKHYGSQGILVASGTLRASWKLYTSTDSLLLRNEATSRGIYYGAAHQSGNGRLPQRKIMDFTDNLLNQIRDMFIDSLNTRIQEAIV